MADDPLAGNRASESNPVAASLPGTTERSTLWPSARTSPPPQIPDHELLQRIGHGSYGEVWLGRNKLGTLRAIKIIHRAAFENARPFEREFKGIQKFEPISRSHEGLVDILQVGGTEEYFYYLMELADAAEPRSEDGGLKVENRSKAQSATCHPPSSILDPRSYAPRTLRSDLKRHGRLPVAECVRIGLSLASALLQRGKSVKRKRAAQRRFVLLRKLSLAAAAAVALVALLPYIKQGKPQRNSAELPEINSLAILPFVNESKAGQDGYLSDALTDETTQAFTNIAGLRVTPRRAAFAFKSTNADPRHAGAQLGVRTVLAGSMQKSNNQLHVAARLIRVADGASLWSTSLDRESSDIGAIQSEVVQHVARQLSFSIHERALRRLETKLVRKLEAYELDKRGQSITALPTLTRDGFSQALECFNRAIALDPNFAAAYVHHASTYRYTCDWYLPPKQVMPEAKRGLLRAIELDGASADAHRELAIVTMVYDWDWSGAEREFRAALKLAPNDFDCHNGYSWFLRVVGRMKEARAEQDVALLLGSDTFYVQINAITLRCQERDYDRALTQCLRMLELYPNSIDGLTYLGWVYEQQGQFQDAIMAF